AHQPEAESLAGQPFEQFQRPGDRIETFARELFEYSLGLAQALARHAPSGQPSYLVAVVGHAGELAAHPPWVGFSREAVAVFEADSQLIGADPHYTLVLARPIRSHQGSEKIEEDSGVAHDNHPFPH